MTMPYNDCFLSSWDALNARGGGSDDPEMVRMLRRMFNLDRTRSDSHTQ